MTKDNFQNFCDTLFAYDYEAKAEELALEGEYKVYLYLSKETDSFIEYGDFEADTMEKELIVLLSEDGYLTANREVTNKVDAQLCWQVWMKFFRNDEIYSAVHIFDYTDDGMQLKSEAVDLAESIEE